jgi:hypothetical protein
MTTGREAAHLAGGALDHGLAKADLPVTGHDNLAAAPHTDDGGAVPTGKSGLGHMQFLPFRGPI